MRPLDASHLHSRPWGGLTLRPPPSPAGLRQRLEHLGMAGGGPNETHVPLRTMARQPVTLAPCPCPPGSRPQPLPSLPNGQAWSGSASFPNSVPISSLASTKERSWICCLARSLGGPTFQPTGNLPHNLHLLTPPAVCTRISATRHCLSQTLNRCVCLFCLVVFISMAGDVGGEWDRVVAYSGG